MIILFVIYLAFLIFCHRLSVIYAFRGKAGMQFLRQRAEKSGNYRRVKKLRFLFIAVYLITFLVVLFFFVYSGIVMLASNGKQGVFMDTAREKGGPILLAILIGYFLAVTGMRLIIRHIMRKAKDREEDSLSAEAVFRVSYTRNPERINRLMLGVILIVFAAWIPIGLIVSPYANSTPGIVLGVIMLGILAFLIEEVIREHRDIAELLVLDRNGIHDKYPLSSVGFIPWQNVMDADVSDTEIVLTLTQTMDGSPDRHERAVIRLDRSPISADIIREKIEQYRLSARQTDQHTAPSDPEA